MQEEIVVFSADSKILVTKVLRLKVREQIQRLTDENKNTLNTTLALKLAFVKNQGLAVELVNLQNVENRPEKQTSNIQVTVELKPEKIKEEQRKRYFDQINRTIVFELHSESSQNFLELFSFSRFESRIDYEDSFLVINVFHIGSLKKKYFIGEAICQVMIKVK